MAVTEVVERAEGRVERPIAGLLRLIGVVLAVLGLALLTTVAIVLGIPDQNDYGLASNLKQDRLESLEGNKIVLVGGSNLAFGIDSPSIEAMTGCPVANMGMNGYFGVRYMLARVKDNLHAGDVVVLAFEWDNYFKSVDGAPVDLLGVSKANPRALGYLTPHQLFNVVTAVPLAAQAKLRRLVGEALSRLQSDEDVDPHDLIMDVESFSGFTPEGDLVSHLGLQWPAAIDQAILADEVDPDVVPLIADFVQDVEAQGVRVILSYTPFMTTAYEERPEPIERAYALLEAQMPGRSPRPPQDYLFEPEMYFDTVYHLDAEGRQVRSALLAGDIVAGSPATCGGAPR